MFYAFHYLGHFSFSYLTVKSGFFMLFFQLPGAFQFFVPHGQNWMFHAFLSIAWGISVFRTSRSKLDVSCFSFNCLGHFSFSYLTVKTGCFMLFFQLPGAFQFFVPHGQNWMFHAFLSIAWGISV